MIAPATKRCFKCGMEKPLSEFYRHPAMGDGYLGKCKECACRDVRENRAAKLDYYREYDKRRFNTERRQQTLTTRRKRFRSAHPEKYRAHQAVSLAIRSGKLVRKPCEKCGEKKVDAHHDDYAKPLDVRWLCRRCHLIEHNNYIES